MTIPDIADAVLVSLYVFAVGIAVCGALWNIAWPKWLLFRQRRQLRQSNAHTDRLTQARSLVEQFRRAYSGDHVQDNFLNLDFTTAELRALSRQMDAAAGASSELAESLNDFGRSLSEVSFTGRFLSGEEYVTGRGVHISLASLVTVFRNLGIIEEDEEPEVADFLIFPAEAGDDGSTRLVMYLPKHQTARVQIRRRGEGKEKTTSSPVTAQVKPTLDFSKAKRQIKVKKIGETKNT